MINEQQARATIADLVTAKYDNASELFQAPTAAFEEDASSVPLLSTRVEIKQRLRDAAMLVPRSNLGEVFHDQYRKIKQALLSNAFGKTAGLAGQIVLVIEAGKTPQSIVEEALALLPDGKAKGVIMNKSKSMARRSGSHYDYYAPGDIKENNLSGLVM